MTIDQNTPDQRAAARATVTDLLAGRETAVLEAAAYGGWYDDVVALADAMAEGGLEDVYETYEVLSKAHPDLRVLVSADDEPAKTWLFEDELVNLPLPEFLGEEEIGEEIAAGQISRVYGPSGAGKTFFVVDRAKRLARLGYNVLYVAAEDVAGVRVRIQAWNTLHTASGRLMVWPEELSLMEPEAVDQFIKETGALELDLIIFDTQAQCSVGADENSNSEMGKLVAAIRRIQRSRTGKDVAALLVHHTGHDDTRARGATALKAAVYTEMRLANSDGLIRLTCDKAKNTAPFDPKHFKLVDADTGLTDRKGQPIKSCVLMPVKSVDDTHGINLNPNMRRALSVLAVADNGTLTRDELRCETNIPKGSFDRTLRQLKADGLISSSAPAIITEAGYKAIGAEPPSAIKIKMTVDTSNGHHNSTTITDHHSNGAHQEAIPSLPS